jgi:hypothetical protein
MNTEVNICFEIPDENECDVMFQYLTDHPKDIWNYEDRVRQKFAPIFEKHLMHEPRWTDSDIIDTRVTRLKEVASRKATAVIQYEVTLRRGASDAKILVDILRRCKSVQEGVVGGNWKINAWYREWTARGWTADEGNDGVPEYQTYTGFNRNVLDLDVTRSSVKTQMLLCEMERILDSFVLSTPKYMVGI